MADSPAKVLDAIANEEYSHLFIDLNNTRDTTSDWLDESNSWIYPYLHAAAGRIGRLRADRLAYARR
jgi:hypothetical protein